MLAIAPALPFLQDFLFPSPLTCLSLPGSTMQLLAYFHFSPFVILPRFDFPVETPPPPSPAPSISLDAKFSVLTPLQPNHPCFFHASDAGCLGVLFARGFPRSLFPPALHRLRDRIRSFHRPPWGTFSSSLPLRPLGRFSRIFKTCFFSLLLECRGVSAYNSIYSSEIAFPKTPSSIFFSG